MNGHPREELSAYADGELSPGDARRVEEHLRRCTECSREVTLYGTMGGAMRESYTRRSRSAGIWEGVHRRITRPVGWILLVVGVVLWAGLALVSWLRQELTLEWLAGSAVLVGLVLLAAGIGYEQYREWKESPYKRIER
jgi:anti-sigma factor RsiW